MARAALIGLSLAAVTAWSCITHLAAGGGASGTGVGIQAGNVCLAAPARPGGSYQPGTVYVANTGRGTEVISLRAGPMSSGHARPVPPAWVTFSYPALSLAPSQGAGVPVTLNIPASARPGQYEAALTASAGGTPASGGGTQAVGPGCRRHHLPEVQRRRRPGRLQPAPAISGRQDPAAREEAVKAKQAKQPKPPRRRRKPTRLGRAVRMKATRTARAAVPYAVIYGSAAIGAEATGHPALAWYAAGAATVHTTIRLHEAYGWHRSGGKAAQRRRARYQGEATAREISRHLSPAAARKKSRHLVPRPGPGCRTRHHRPRGGRSRRVPRRPVPGPRAAADNESPGPGYARPDAGRLDDDGRAP